ncbi:hypothetical protein DXX93_05985 [Thalassotalea euphylliae]|uniref:Tse2 ADP-ribosyltransferase toxin domain-containing protein n=1 Tax=Thalassotalea euphylliae TaxID=1655234 RepID=A0A3E0TQE4_9GAMM|nr:hypothetical protein [Thalassotalea euphylliae]REL26175.1 hypothetical protein DXX93_05985 [Thalassotalea euphylliae]
MAQTNGELYRAIHVESPEFEQLDSVAACRKGATSNGLLHARASGEIAIGADGLQLIEAADVNLERSADDAPWYVLTDGGTSMHDVPGWFGYTTWNYFHVPKGTQYCAETLFIKRDKKRKWNRHKTAQGRHYTIRPKIRMRLDAYFGALDNLARAAIVRSIELKQPVRLNSANESEPASSTSKDETSG